METKRSPKIGFTLVELLVVITIITILAALLIPAVYFAIQKAKEGRIAIELANIEKALERYKIEYGEYPPDFSELGEYPSDPSTRAQLAGLIIQDHLSRIFRSRDVATDIPRDQNGNPLSPSEQAKLLSRLGPHNALYFWLRGFSSDPAHPLFGGGERQPFFEFDKNRLRDLATIDDKLDDGQINNSSANAPKAFNLDQGESVVLAEYIPQSNASPESADTEPLVYFRANKVTLLGSLTFYGALGQAMSSSGSRLPPARSEPYRVYASAALWALEWNKSNGQLRPQMFLPSYVASYRAPLPYFSFESSVVPEPNVLPSPRNQVAPLLPYAAPDKFQLLSAGLGEDFGAGGGNMRLNQYDPADKKMMTSMTGGKTLEDLQE